MEKDSQGLSAGRVQSAALKLICDREKQYLTLYQKNTGQLQLYYLNKTRRMKLKQNWLNIKVKADGRQ